MKNSIIILLFCSTFIQCHKDDKPSADPASQTEYHYIQESIKPFEVKANSYWVYKNDSTGVQDSISVLSTDDKTDNQSIWQIAMWGHHSTGWKLVQN